MFSVLRVLYSSLVPSIILCKYNFFLCSIPLASYIGHLFLQDRHKFLKLRRRHVHKKFNTSSAARETVGPEVGHYEGFL